MKNTSRVGLVLLVVVEMGKRVLRMGAGKQYKELMETGGIHGLFCTASGIWEFTVSEEGGGSDLWVYWMWVTAGEMTPDVLRKIGNLDSFGRREKRLAVICYKADRVELRFFMYIRDGRIDGVLRTTLVANNKMLRGNGAV